MAAALGAAAAAVLLRAAALVGAGANGAAANMPELLESKVELLRRLTLDVQDRNSGSKSICSCQ